MGQNEEQKPDAQIRFALKDVLAASEKRVSSTTEAILAAIRQEVLLQEVDTNKLEEQDLELEPGSFVPSVNGRVYPQTAHRSLRPTRKVWQNIAAIAAVAVIILASVALFNHRLLVLPGDTASTPTGHKTPAQSLLSPTHVVATSSVNSPTGVSSFTPTSSAMPVLYEGWNRVALVTPQLTLANLNYLTDCCTILDTVKLPATTTVDGISQDGQNVMYHTVSDGVTVYYIVSLARKNFAIYSFQGNGGNAIWMDSTHVLLTTYNSVVEIDVQTGAVSTLLPSFVTPHLMFYRDPFLYFIGGLGRTMDALYRINVNSGNVQQITYGSKGAAYWLNPGGAIVYFANSSGPAGNPGIYAVNSDGTNLHLLRQYAYGTPIGYAADNSLMIMRVERGAFQVLKLGATAQQDQLVLDDAAPGASTLCLKAHVGADPICGGNFALAPYGHALVVQGLYADGTYKVWSDDLTTFQQMLIPSLSGIHAPIQLIGWDKIPTP
jgi:hypothetical protein